MPTDKPIDREALKKYIAEELENVRKLKKQLTDSQVARLCNGYSRKEIHETLLEMENHAPLAKKYRSVYLTLKNWMDLKRTKAAIQRDNQVRRFGVTAKMNYHEALTWLERKGLPLSSLADKFTPEKDKNGKTYWILKD